MDENKFLGYSMLHQRLVQAKCKSRSWYGTLCVTFLWGKDGVRREVVDSDKVEVLSDNGNKGVSTSK